MELITELSDIDIDPSWAGQLQETATREAARAIVLNDLGELALLYVAKDNYYKLPGGGLEHGEDCETALRRELMEEAGATVEVLGEVGMIIEHRSTHQLKQISCCYLARAIGNMHQPSYTDEETEDGFRLQWVSFRRAAELLEGCRPEIYAGKFIKLRDMAFLKRASELLESGDVDYLQKGKC